MKTSFCFEATSYDGGQTFSEVCLHDEWEYLGDLNDTPAELVQNETSTILWKVTEAEESPASGKLYKPLWSFIRLQRSDVLDFYETLKVKKLDEDELTKTIISRGYEDDECFMMVDLSMGAAYVEANLYPYSKNGSGSSWWNLVQTLMKILLLNLDETAEVNFQTLLDYTDPFLVDRPTRFTYVVSFMAENYDLSPLILQLLYNLKCNSSIPPKMDEYEKLLEELETMVLKEKPASLEGQVASLEGQAASQPARKKKGLSVWDFVPIVGSIRTIREGIDDFKEGDKIGGAINCTLGGLFLILDISTLGAAASFVGGAIKTGAKSAGISVVKEVGVEVVKTGSKRTLKRAAQRKAAKLLAKEAAKQAVKTASKETIEQLAKKWGVKFIKTIPTIAAVLTEMKKLNDERCEQRK